ncbi:3-keto-disaccharide hydrolase [Mucilaginibacter pallidiroseus]|nr:DUF1080 domain-containing protein [Mucilaginibacter pallidiroseus]
MAAASIVLLAACTKPADLPNTLTDEEKADGWQLLFNGKDMQNWHIFNQGNQKTAWSVKDGALWADPLKVNDKHGDLVSDKIYENFDLKFEWKIAKGGNSGVFVDVQEDPKYDATFVTAPELQLLDDANAEERHKKDSTHWAGAMYNVIARSKDAKPNPFGQWNTSRIVQQGGKITYWLNGVESAKADLKDAGWPKLIAGTPMKAYRDFGKFTKGHLAIQDHNNEVFLRSIKIKQL